MLFLNRLKNALRYRARRILDRFGIGRETISPAEFNRAVATIASQHRSVFWGDRILTLA